ncbi:MAG: hypothetical protein FD121_968 [Gallionellaceae bacterium]|nr:MAG: hypothetical protein FD121_968 [Gallionellaceae bacterium]
MRTRLISCAANNPTQKIIWAAFALIAAIAWFGSANASELGRLFYTPQQRAQLEAQQLSGATIEGVKRNFIVVNGVIQKHGGNRIVWLNGEAQTPVRANNNPASIDVAVPGKSKHVQVKVGQRLMLDTPVPDDSSGTPTQSQPKPASDDD